MRFIKFLPLLAAFAAGALSPAMAGEEGHGDHKGWIEHVCAPADKDGEKADRAQRHADHVAERLKLTDAQKAAFKDLQDVRAKLHADHKAALCASKPDLSTFEKRFAFKQTMLENRLATLKGEAPKLLAFYNSLDEKQKTAFDEMMKHRRHHRHHGWDRHGWHHHHHHHHGDE
jgi:hypothetical protein